MLLFHAGGLPSRFEFRHRVRAVFAGDWSLPPLRGEAMYDPTIVGTTAGDQRLVIRP